MGGTEPDPDSDDDDIIDVYDDPGAQVRDPMTTNPDVNADKAMFYPPRDRP